MSVRKRIKGIILDNVTSDGVEDTINIEEIVQDLIKAGIIMPDLPEPDWESDGDASWYSLFEDGYVYSIAGLVGLTAGNLPPEMAKEYGYQIIAAANHAQPLNETMENQK